MTVAELAGAVEEGGEGGVGIGDSCAGRAALRGREGAAVEEIIVATVNHSQPSVLLVVGNDVGRIRAAYRHALTMERKSMRPELWDGHTAERIAAILVAG